MKAVVLYMPVVHKGYLNFFESLKNIDTIFVISTDIARDLQSSLRKDIRALDSSEIVRIVSSFFSSTTDVREFNIYSNTDEYDEFVLPDEEISRQFANKYLDYKTVEFVSVFLRWDSKNSVSSNEVFESFEISSAEFDKKIMNACRQESARSADWWRRVGGCIVKGSNVILPPIHNQHVPNPIQPYFDGDPRSSFHKGENIEIGTALHVELSLIAMAAEIGFGLSGASLYVTTFPCPWCAKAIAYSGIEKVYFEEGYSVLDAQSILESNDVKIIRVVK